MEYKYKSNANIAKVMALRFDAVRLVLPCRAACASTEDGYFPFCHSSVHIMHGNRTKIYLQCMKMVLAWHGMARRVLCVYDWNWNGLRFATTFSCVLLNWFLMIFDDETSKSAFFSAGFTAHFFGLDKSVIGSKYENVHRCVTAAWGLLSHHADNSAIEQLYFGLICMYIACTIVLAQPASMCESNVRTLEKTVYSHLVCLMCVTIYSCVL